MDWAVDQLGQTMITLCWIRNLGRTPRIEADDDDARTAIGPIPINARPQWTPI